MIVDYISTNKNPTLVDTLLGFDRSSRPFEASVDINPNLYCAVYNNLPMGCMSENILDLWKFNNTAIEHLTKENILVALNTTTISLSSGHETDFVHLLGGVQRNVNGSIVSATSLLTKWMVYVNFTAVDHDKTGNIAGTEDWVCIFFVIGCVKCVL